jgi:hypothetical protein
MTAYIDMSAADLAGYLRRAGACKPYTGPLSMLDEATLAYRDKSPELDAAQRAFAEARYPCMRRDVPDEAWAAVAVTAAALAALLESLGTYVIPRCKRTGPCGTCNMPLDADGECRSSLGHTDGGG